MREQSNGDGAAGRASADELAASHVTLVAHIVRETMARVPAHVDRDDLNSAGLVALVNAARAFDPERGLPFARYASHRIRGAILDELRGIDWASRSVRRRARDIDRVRGELASSLGRVPEDAQVAQSLGLTMDEIRHHEEDLARANVLSLQGSSETPWDDLIRSSSPTPEQVVEDRERLTYLTEAVAELPERLRAVVEGYFLEERPMAEIAAELGVSESRISQIRAEALVLLRGALDFALEPTMVPRSENPDGCAARRRDTYFRAVAERHAAGRQLPRLALDTTG